MNKITNIIMAPPSDQALPLWQIVQREAAAQLVTQ
jgi:hypothetical protein